MQVDTPRTIVTLRKLETTGLLPGTMHECAIKATDDLSAVESWLNEYINNQNTYNTYKGEVTKFLLWCHGEVKLKFSELKKEDLVIYIEWLKNPPAKLIKKKGERVYGECTHKPFKAAQSYTAVKFNIRVINSLFNYLVEADYLYKNPLRLIKQFTKFQDVGDRTLAVKARILEDHEFKAVIDTLAELPEVGKKSLDYKAQAKLIFALLYHLGLRVSELSYARWDNFKIVQGRCWYFLIGKGLKPGQIPVNDELLSIVHKYREYLGLNGVGDTGISNKIENFEHAYILNSKKTGLNLSARRIREIVKEIFSLAANKFTDKAVQDKLRSAFPHDLRHLLASDLDRCGVSIVDTKEILRHSSEKTTEIYRNSKESKRHAAIQGNQVGMTGLLNSNVHNYTVITIKVECKPQNILSFGYFINSVASVYLRQYRLVEAVDTEQLKLQFKRQAKNYTEIVVRVVIDELLQEDALGMLRNAIERAAVVRDLKVKCE